MIKTLKIKLSKHKILISNFNFMTILQLSQLLMPLLIYPYLIRVLGKEIYGIIAYSNAIILYFLTFISFGFNISEIKEISIDRDDNEKISKVVSAVLIIRTILFFLAFCSLLILVLAVPILNEHKWLYFAYFGTLINGALNPSFYFQGIEKMKFITIITVVSNLIFLILTFFMVKSASQYVLVPLFTSIGSLLGCSIGLYIVFFKEGLSFSFQPFDLLRKNFRNSIPFFSSRVSALIIEKTNLILLGSFVGYTEVAYYDLANKFATLMKTPLNILNQVLFPNVSRTQNISLVIKTLRIILIFYIMGYLSLFFLGEPMIILFGGIDLLPSKYVLYILGISVVINLISTFLGAPMLLATGHKNEYNNSIIFSSLFYFLIVLILYLFKWIGLYQLASLTTVTGIFVLLFRISYCRKFKLI